MLGKIAAAKETITTTGKLIRLFTIPLLIPYKLVAAVLENPLSTKILIISKLSKNAVIGNIKLLRVVAAEYLNNLTNASLKGNS